MSCVKLHPIQIKQLSQRGASKFDTINCQKKKKLRPSVWNFAKLKIVFAWKIENNFFILMPVCSFTKVTETPEERQNILK